MNFGTENIDLLGQMDKETAFKLLDHYYENGGNFIDTANNYQNGQSEEWIGDWLKEREKVKNIRDEIVIATKYTSNHHRGDKIPGIQVNYAGNSRKSLFTSVEASLRKLQTTYIDLLYVHWWDYTTPIEEVMQGLNQLVVSGKVLYFGISDTPAFVVARANQYARDHGLAQFVVYQGKWSIAVRDIEREIIPMTKLEGMGIAPWGVLGQGMFKTDEEIEKLKETGEKTRAQRGKGYEATREITKVLQNLATAKNTTISGICIAYVLQKTPYVFPILGGRKLEHLQQNIDGLGVKLTEEDIKIIDAASPIVTGFPYDMIGQNSTQCWLLGLTAKYDWVEEPKAIVPK